MSEKDEKKEGGIDFSELGARGKEILVSMGKFASEFWNVGKNVWSEKVETADFYEKVKKRADEVKGKVKDQLPDGVVKGIEKLGEGVSSVRKNVSEKAKDLYEKGKKGRSKKE